MTLSDEEYEDAVMTRGRWVPLAARTVYGRPDVGAVIASGHAVWRVTGVHALPLTEQAREDWLEAGMPDLDTWRAAPYAVTVAHIGGARPGWAKPGQPVQDGRYEVDGSSSVTWYVYRPPGRWPQCSCCGEPMPCRATLEDHEVRKSLRAVETFVRREPGSCWGCGNPITTRQRWVAYPGDNLDLPGGIEVRFHRRSDCAHWAERYELRWIAVDPRRERILTWPKCAGLLLVHGDGSSQCHTGTGPLGLEHAGVHDCGGHLTHEHGSRAACYVTGPCCPSTGHPGAHPSPRPPRRTTTISPSGRTP